MSHLSQLIQSYGYVIALTKFVTVRSEHFMNSTVGYRLLLYYKTGFYQAIRPLKERRKEKTV